MYGWKGTPLSETSRFWNGTSVGDASPTAPYEATSEFSQVMMALAGTLSDPNLGAVCYGDPEGTLTITGATSPISMAAGHAIVYGAWYYNSSAATLVIPTPGAATRKDLIVLRKDWAAQTVRLTRVAGVEGGAVAPPVQVVGTTWDYPLYEASITTGGVITLTDRRTYVGKPQTSTGLVLVSRAFFHANQTVTSTAAGGTYVDFAGGFQLGVIVLDANSTVIIRANATVGVTAGSTETTTAGLALDKDNTSKLLGVTSAPHTFLTQNAGGAVEATVLSSVSFEVEDVNPSVGAHQYKVQGIVMTNAAGNTCYFGDGADVSITVEIWKAP